MAILALDGGHPLDKAIGYKMNSRDNTKMGRQERKISKSRWKECFGQDKCKRCLRIISNGKF